MNTRNLGSLRCTSDGRQELTFERIFRHNPDKVWRAITDPQHLSEWFAKYLDYNRSRLNFSDPGADLTFAPAAETEHMPIATGRVLRSEPPTILEYTWGEEILRWELAPAGDESCRLIFTNIFDDASFAPYNALGWHTGLEQLSAVLDGRDANAITLEVDEAAASDLQREYERAFA